MASRLRDAAPPFYLFCCLILGGSSQGIWANMLLQLFGLALIAWAALTPAGERLPRQQRQLFGLVILGLTLVALQLIPLSPALWEPLGPRHLLADGYKVLGIPAPSLPLSVAPYDTLTAVLALIPSLAMLASTIRLGSRPPWLVIAVIAGTVAGILLGALQISSPDPLTSAWYLYEDTNNGVATGFFANANHMAILLVISLPFLAAILASAGAKGRNVQRYSAVVALIVGAAVVVAVGIALNGSLAGYGLAVPVLMASAAIVLPARNRAIRWLASAAAILLIGAVGWLATTPLNSRGALQANAATSVSSRQEIVTTSIHAARDFMPLGAGVGTFRRVYALYEDHDRLDPTTYVNHAHNDISNWRWRPACPDSPCWHCSCCGGVGLHGALGVSASRTLSPARRPSHRPRSWSTAWSTSRCAPRQSEPVSLCAWRCWCGKSRHAPRRNRTCGRPATSS